MDVQVDLRVMELLASRLCHDLVGPIGAIGNGIELLEEDDAEMAQDALELAAGSARQAASALQFYRLAYGMAGARLGGDLGELRSVASAFLEHGKIDLDWRAELPAEDTPDGVGKLILNMIVLAAETLPRGGSLAVAAERRDGAVQASVTVAGAGAGLRPDAAPALADEVALDELTPRNVHGYFTRLVARRLGAELRVETPRADAVRVAVTVPA